MPIFNVNESCNNICWTEEMVSLTFQWPQCKGEMKDNGPGFLDFSLKEIIIFCVCPQMQTSCKRTNSFGKPRLLHLSVVYLYTS